MNAKHLVTSLSQQLDTSCIDFPDGFEETQQQQVSTTLMMHFSSLRMRTREIRVHQIGYKANVNPWRRFDPM